MKTKLTFAAVVLMMALTFAPSANAQLDTQDRAARIPFAFHVENQELPAGDYLIGWLGGRLHIHSVDGKYSATAIALPVNGTKTQASSKLEFQRYGSVVFLSRMWIAGTETGRELLKTRHEVELAKQQGGTVIALAAEKR